MLFYYHLRMGIIRKCQASLFEEKVIMAKARVIAHRGNQ